MLYFPTCVLSGRGPPPAGEDVTRALIRAHLCARGDLTPRCHEQNERPKEKRRGQSADRRTFHWRHHADAAACSAEHARLSALHRGSRCGSRHHSASGRASLFGGSLPRGRKGLWTLSTAKLSQTPGRPVLVPAGSMPETARERIANPRAGAAPAPHSGQPSGKRPSVSELAYI